jgi:RNA polymerase sigma-70 factor (ECF subfamily)
MDLQEFTKTIDPIKNKLYRFALRYVKNPQEAEDVVQEVFIKLWNNREQMQEINNVEAWCMRVTRNLSIDKLRSKHNRTDDIPEGTNWLDNSAGPDKQTELNEAVEKIKKWIEELPEAQRNVIQLRDIEEFSYKEIAEALEISMELVKVNLHRARKVIRKKILESDSYGIQD